MTASRKNLGEGRREPAPAPRRAIAYLRVSTSLQAEQGMGLDVQRDRVSEYASEHGLQLIEVVKEAASGGIQDGETFSWEHRPVLLSLLERAEQGEYDVLLVARLDRLSRDHATLVVVERQLQKVGVEVISTAEQNGDGAMAEFIRGQVALVAQLERAMIRERLSAGKAKAKAQGRHAHGRVPYGYRSTRGVLEPVDELAPVVRRIFVELRDGRSPGRVARMLTAEGIPGPQRAASWSQQTIRVIATNSAYCGERNTIKHAHPPIISRRLFNDVQRAIVARQRTI